MPSLQPFRGVRYDADREPALGISPPYDAIDVELHRKLLSGHPRNSVRWTLGEDPDRPRGSTHEYEARGRLVRDWLAEGILCQDEEHCFYRYTLDYTADGGNRTYRGLLALVETADWREDGLYPHEEIKQHVMEDRLALLRASAVDMGVLHLVIRDPGNRFTPELNGVEAEPLFSGRDLRGGGHRLERIAKPEAIDRFRSIVGSTPCAMADGHHRYTTFIEGRRQGVPGTSRALVFIGDLDQPGLTIRPTHRLFSWKEGSGAAASLAQAIVKELDDHEGLRWSFRTAGQGELSLETRIDLEKPTLTRRLADLAAECNPAPEIERTHDVARAKTRLEAAPSGSALFCELPAVTKEEFWTRATAGEVFPPKTTWFAPKISTGIVAHLLEG